MEPSSGLAFSQLGDESDSGWVFQKIARLMNFVGVKTVGHGVWHTAFQHTFE
jgi:hypothetical protein